MKFPFVETRRGASPRTTEGDIVETRRGASPRTTEGNIVETRRGASLRITEGNIVETCRGTSPRITGEKYDIPDFFVFLQVFCGIGATCAVH